MPAGVLSAERDGGSVRFTIQYPEGFDHSVMIEVFGGMRDVVDAGGGPVVDENGVQVREEVWTPIHTGTAKFVESDTDWEYPSLDAAGNPVPLQFPRTYRALTYRRVSDEGQVRLLQTDGVYSDCVTVV